MTASLLRKLAEATRIKEPQITELGRLLVMAETDLASDLRRPTEEDLAARVRHVVWPVATVVVV